MNNKSIIIKYPDFNKRKNLILDNYIIFTDVLPEKYIKLLNMFYEIGEYENKKFKIRDIAYKCGFDYTGDEQHYIQLFENAFKFFENSLKRVSDVKKNKCFK